MPILAETEICGGYIRYLPVKRLDEETRKIAVERFEGFKEKGVIQDNTYTDDIWTISDEVRTQKVDFSFDATAYRKQAMSWIGCTADCFSECMKAYAAMLLGDMSLSQIRIVIREIAAMAVLSSGEAARIVGKKNYHLASFLAMIPLGNDLRDHVIEELEDTRIEKRSGKARKLADFDRYLSFDRSMKEFWNKAGTEEKRFFFPVYFWWNLTAILPLRPTEFLLTPWDCIREYEGKCILTIRRTRMKKGEKHGYKISEDYELCSYEITKELYAAINQYRTLVSDEDRPEIGTLFIPERNVPSGYFSLHQMRRRLKAFCREVLHDSSYPIHLGDTRHLAMVNLILSGGSPVICRELAGHEDIDISSHYYSNMSMVVESIVTSRFRGWDPSSALDGQRRYYLSLPEKRFRVANGWCDHLPVAAGDVSECIRSYVPGGQIGNCMACIHFYADHKGMRLEILDKAKKQVDEDGIYLMQMIELVRKSLGYEEDIDQALLRIRLSGDRYGKLLSKVYREGK